MAFYAMISAKILMKKGVHYVRNYHITTAITLEMV